MSKSEFYEILPVCEVHIIFYHEAHKEQKDFIEVL
jgi:hypothetical protein